MDHEEFLKANLSDYENRKENLLKNYPEIIHRQLKKITEQRRVLKWNGDFLTMMRIKHGNYKEKICLQRFLKETDETKESLKDKLIFDAGCGNGQLNQYIARCGAIVVGMDLSRSVERAFLNNKEENAFFLQGDVQYPPLQFEKFDIVHSSGVLICTNNSELTFSKIEPCVKKEW